jgi:hypothetical protein
VSLVMIDYTWRLAGVREDLDTLHWNVRPGHPAAESARFRVRTDEGGEAEMRYDARGADLRLGGKQLGRIESGVVRLVTNRSGAPRELVGISEQPQRIVIQLTGRVAREVAVRPNQRIAL